MTRLSAGAAPAWLTVRIGDVELALPIEAVGEVLPAPLIAPVPFVPPWVAGIVSVRGAVVPVLDPGMRLFGRAASRDGRLVLTAADEAGERMGVLVDTVTGLIDRSEGELESRAGKRGGAVPARFAAAAVARAAGGRVPVLDLAALLEPDATGADAPGV